MAKNISRNIPVVERTIEFIDVDLTDKVSVTYCAEQFMNSKAWRKMDRHYPLNLIHRCYIEQYEKECPIVRYKCDGNSTFSLDAKPRLNSFIESITVSVVGIGRRSLFNKFDVESFVEPNVVAYYTDHFGVNHVIDYDGLYRLLLQKPNLVVSPEGVLIFFTDKEIIATLNCNDCIYYISEQFINLKNKTVNDIVVGKNYCKIVVLSKKGKEIYFRLNFDFDFTSYQMLVPEVHKQKDEPMILHLDITPQYIAELDGTITANIKAKLPIDTDVDS